MADFALTAAQVAPVHPGNAEIYDYIMAVALTLGQIVYIDSSGDADLADASAAGTAGFRGVVVDVRGGIGGVASVLVRGAVYGFTITQAYDADVFVSDTAGSVADAAGTVSVLCGRVMPLSDNDRTKVLYFSGIVG